MPWPLQVVSLPNWQAEPAKPASQVQLPSAIALPWPLQAVASLYWQAEPAKPESQVQAPVALQVPWPLQVSDAEQYAQDG